MFVSEFSIWVSTSKKVYQTAKKLLETSVNDPPNEPYRSKYLARNVLDGLVKEIEEKWMSNRMLQVQFLSALFKYEMGVIDIDTEEISAGCDILTSAFNEVQDVSGTQEGCFLSINILNKLGILWSSRGEVEKALDYLLKAETVYENYKTSTNAIPFVFDDFFTMSTNSDDNWPLFEKAHTYTLFYLAQIYGHLDEDEKSAKYCRETLKRQKESGEFEPNDWTTNCTTLSQFYIMRKLFKEARHLLSCAACVLLKYEMKVEENKDLWAEVHKIKATISCSWLKYSIAVLTDAKNPDKEVADSESFTRLTDEEEVKMKENQIPCFISSYDDARCLFVFAQNHISVATSFYTLSDYASNYSQIIQDHSRLYQSLAALEPDPSRQCKMHKRRLDMLQELFNKLNPQFFLSICRQLQFEMAEICHEMMDLKFRIAGENPDAKTLLKINSFANKGISHFNEFLITLKNKDGEFPSPFSDEIVRPALIAHFYIAKYYSKLTECDTNKKMDNLASALKYYSFIVDYVDRNPIHSSSMENELPVIQEMIELMPQKMQQIRGSVLF